MATARALYSDLVLNFTLGTNTSPNIDQVAAIITQLYIDAYTAAYGVGTYQVYSASDEDPVIDTEECKAIIIADMQDLTNAWAKSFDINSTTKAPRLRLTDDAMNEVAELTGSNIYFASREDDDLQEIGDTII